jgi:primosomal protein N''
VETKIKKPADDAALDQAEKHASQLVADVDALREAKTAKDVRVYQPFP